MTTATTPPDLTREEATAWVGLPPETVAFLRSKMGRAPRSYEGSALEQYHLDVRATQEMRSEERDREFDADYLGSDVATDRELSSRSRATRMQRTPPWADFDAIRSVYRAAWELGRSTGVPHHVDHVLPLQGRRVSGLHVHYNLRAIPAFDNLSKGNRFEVEP